MLKHGSNQPLFKISLISFLILFLELLVIRLIGTEIRIFAYLSNLVLLATFIGSGIGMAIKKKVPLFLTSLLILGINLILVMRYIVRLPNLEFQLFSGITEMLSPLSESYIWAQLYTFSKTGIGIGILLTLLIFWVILFTFMPLGQFLGNLLNRYPRPLVAYSVNIIASLAGMWAFNGLSFLGISPFVGLVLVQGLLLILLTDKTARLYGIVSLVASLVLLTPRVAKQPYEGPVTYWSPYQKLRLSLIAPEKLSQATGWYLEVNNVGYMGLFDLSAKGINKRLWAIETLFPQDSPEFTYSNQYALPYLINSQTQKALIIGGGAGNDAAAAVKAGIPYIQVVEIDPQIVALGKKYHPEKPYDQPGVAVTVDDGRAFIERTQEQFDVIVMSLADSHTMSSSLTNVQLDNYLYTQESLQKVKQLLTDEGIFLLSFEITRPWIGERIQQTVTQAFGFTPKIFTVRSQGVYGWGGTFFLITKSPQRLEQLLAETEDLAAFINENSQDYTNKQIKVLSDNWPYIYLDHPRIPTLHLVVALLIISFLVLARKEILSGTGLHWPMFFLGAGFMLYEVQNISRASLIFGNTWVTNLFIISGVLSFILIANFATEKKLIALRPATLFLFITILIQLLVPLSFFTTLTPIIKTVTAMVFLNLPHFFSAIVFAHLFVASGKKSLAFGSNLLGSAFGGFMEMFSFLWGLQSLILFTLFFYAVGTVKFWKQRV